VSDEAHGFVTEIIEPKDKVDGWISSIKSVRSAISYTCVQTLPNIDVSANNLKSNPDSTPHPIGKAPASGIDRGQVPHLC